MSLFTNVLRFFRKLAELLQAPQTNARLIVVMIGILVIVALAILIAFYLVVRGLRQVLYPPKPTAAAGPSHPFTSKVQPDGEQASDPTADPVSLRRERPQYARLAILIGSVFGGLLALMIIGGLATSASGFCGKACHSMNPVYQSWRRSSHAKVACVSCHTSGNIFANTKNKYSAAVNVFKEISGRYPSPINADSEHGEKTMVDSGCVNCHVLNGLTIATGVRAGAVSKVYPKHRRVGLKCVTCHNRVAHPRAEKYDPLPGKDKAFRYLDYMRMKDGCLRCHQQGGKFVDAVGKTRLGPFEAKNGAVARTKCSVCHEKGQLESTVKMHGDTTVIHANAGKQRSQVCLFCHASMRGPRTPFHQTHLADIETKLECASCHQTVEEGARSAGGKIRVDRKVCRQCHKTGFISYTKAHLAKSWAKDHRRLKRVNTRSCMQCHKQPELDFCDKCHEYHPHDEKWVNRGHGKKALASVPLRDFKTGAVSCTRCHDKETFCATKCHKGIMVPHDKLRVWMKDEVEADREACNLCHKASTGLNYCGTRCHHDNYYSTYNLSKTVPWRVGQKRHGVVVKAEGVQSCLRCHNQSTWCTTQCHQGVTMPHVAGWRSVHFKNVPYGVYEKFPKKRLWKQEKAVCNMCHNKDGQNPNFCFACHHQRFFPSDMPKKQMDWRYLMTIANEQFGTTYNLENAEPCAECHDVIPFCSQCHGRRDD